MNELVVRKSNIPESLSALKPRDRRICAEFLQDRDIWGAASRSGMKTERLTNKFLQGLKKRLAPFINAYEEEILADIGISNQRIMDELALLAFYDPKNLFTQDSFGYITIRDFDELGELSRAIAGVERVVNTKDHTETIKVKLYSKTEALEKIMRAKGMFKDSASSGVNLQLNVNFGGA